MFRRAFPSRSSLTVATHHRPRREPATWTPREAAAMVAAAGVAVTAEPTSGAPVTADDRRSEDAAVAARLDRAWRRMADAHAVTEGRTHGIGDDTARRDPLTQPFPIAFGTTARTTRATRVGMAPTGMTASTPAPAPAPARNPYAPVAAPGSVPTGRPRRPMTTTPRHRSEPTPRLHRGRAPRPLTVDRWSPATG